MVSQSGGPSGSKERGIVTCLPGADEARALGADPDRHPMINPRQMINPGPKSLPDVSPYKL